jgi:cell division protein FtsA
VEEILNYVAKEINRAGFANPLISGAVLTGGTSLVQGLPELAEEIFNLPTRRGYPVGVGGLTDVIHDPAYATAVGLVLYASQLQQKQQRRRPSRRGGGGMGSGFWVRLKNWFREVF